MHLSEVKHGKMMLMFGQAMKPMYSQVRPMSDQARQDETHVRSSEVMAEYKGILVRNLSFWSHKLSLAQAKVR